MSDETVETNDGTWSGLKKTIIGTLTTVITGGGVYLGTFLYGGNDSDKEEVKTEQAAPAAAPVINLSVDNSSKNMNTAQGGSNTTTVIHKTEKAAPVKEEKKKSESEDAPW
jgi:hypothetical protein